MITESGKGLDAGSGAAAAPGGQHQGQPQPAQAAAPAAVVVGRWGRLAVVGGEVQVDVQRVVVGRPVGIGGEEVVDLLIALMCQAPASTTRASRDGLARA